MAVWVLFQDVGEMIILSLVLAARMSIDLFICIQFHISNNTHLHGNDQGGERKSESVYE